MATGNARRFQELGVPEVLAKELAAQITASTGDARRLIELGMMQRIANTVAATVVTHTLTAAQVLQLTNAGWPGPVVIEFRAQIGS